MDNPAKSAQQLMKDLKYHTGPYAEYALQARKQYLNLRLRQDKDIRYVYARAIKRIGKEIRHLAKTNGNKLKIRHLMQLERTIAQEMVLLNGYVDELIARYINEGVAIGSYYSQAITTQILKEAGMKVKKVSGIYARVNKKAVEAIYARTQNGVKVSRRVWKSTQTAEKAIKNIIREGVTLGEDAVSVARALERYVLADRLTLTDQYPGMMNRMGSRIPKNLSYEALRLARTEMTAAYGEGTILGGQASPTYTGIRWMLSSSHPVRDICDDLAGADHGLGKGVYPKGEEPRYPAHPNCLCFLIPVHKEPKDVVKSLKAWMKNPQSQPDIERWYKDIYEVA